MKECWCLREWKSRAERCCKHALSLSGRWIFKTWTSVAPVFSSQPTSSPTHGWSAWPRSPATVLPRPYNTRTNCQAWWSWGAIDCLVWLYRGQSSKPSNGVASSHAASSPASLCALESISKPPDFGPEPEHSKVCQSAWPTPMNRPELSLNRVGSFFIAAGFRRLANLNAANTTRTSFSRSVRTQRPTQSQSAAESLDCCPHWKEWCRCCRWRFEWILIWMFGKRVTKGIPVVPQGGGGSFKNGKPIGEVSWCDAKMAERTHWWIERWLSVSPFLSLFLSFSLCLSFAIYLQSYLSSHLCLCLFFYVSIYVSIYLSIDLSIYLSICPSI